MKRAVIIVSDTDSSFVHFGRILKFFMAKILPYRLFKSKKDLGRYKNKILNVLSNMASTALKETLWNYTGNVNIAKEDRKYIKAKSEFLYSRVVVTYAKKSGDKNITVAKSGKVTVKKGTKKGTYKIKVKVTAAGNKSYAKKTKTVTFTIKVQ